MISTPEVEPKKSADGTAEERRKFWFRTTRIEIAEFALVCLLKEGYIS
jgi:hypothetical protein